MKRLLAVVLVAYVATTGVLYAVGPEHRDLWPFVVLSALFGLAVLALWRARLSRRATAILVLGVGAVLQMLALIRGPLTSDDANRYVWDAKVQFAGIDPYRWAPQDPHLRQLREPDLFGPTSSCAHVIPEGCTGINRPDVRTVYPPVAQVAFDAGRLASGGGHGGVRVYQVLGALGALAIAALLTRRALRRRETLWPVALWAWCPIVVSEFGNNGHLDWLAALLTLLGIDAAARKRAGWAGFLVGAATMTKLYPVLVLPALLRRRPWLVGVAAAATVAVSYLPHVLAVGTKVLGYLPGYLHEQGYDSGSGLLLIDAVVPHPVDKILAAVALAAAALWAWRRADAEAPEVAATVLVGAAFLVTTPVYGWYAGLLLALVVVSRRFEWLPVAFAPSVVYLTNSSLSHLLAYAVAAVAALACAMTQRARKSTPREPVAHASANA